ncbi:FecCD family ABC transporter permease [Deinococcus maricopensis]|uniref:FecCD family ABC transporter permease n=1 Tax=Deinococcus maricopensis TaxID=309887 RepID=UPI0005C146FF|nr:iron ABC transporter permease [Deinococcus maricopensis]
MTASPDRAPAPRRRVAVLLPLLLAALLLLAVVALGLGAVRTPPADVLRALTGAGDELTSRILLELRLPRVLVAALTGAMFAASGVILQGVVRNPLASPDLVGVGAGAGLAATVLLLAAPAAPAWALPVGAFVGAWLGFAAVYLLSRGPGGLSPARLALIGIAVGSALGAMQQLVIVRAPDGVASALAFLVGTVYGADWPRVTRVLPWAALLPASMLLARRLDVLSFGEDIATALGTRVNVARGVALSVAVGLAAAAVTGSGILGFVGLIAPHLARLLVGGLHARLLPLAMLLGALLALGADTVGRALLPPLEIPAGIVTTLIGAPYFLWLLRRQGGKA